MILNESREMYLETIHVLHQKSPSVRSLDIAEYMGYSKPSVSRAVGLLKEADYISVDQDGYITLTETGKEIAEKIYDRHVTLTKVFTMLGVEEKTAAEDACKIEHDISDATFTAIKAYLASQQAPLEELG